MADNSIITEEELSRLLINLTSIKGEVPVIDFEENGLLRTLLQIFQSNQIDYKQAKKIIYGAKAAIMHTNNKFIKFSKEENFNNLISSIIIKDRDLVLFQKIAEADEEFNKYFRKNFSAEKKIGELMASLWELSINELRENISLSSEKMESFSRESVEIYSVFASLYSSIISHIGAIKDEEGIERIADQIVKEKIASNKTVVKKLISKKDQVEAFDKFLDKLMNDPKADPKDIFTAEEVARLLKKTFTIVSFATAEKWNSVSRELNSYIDKLSIEYNDKTIKDNFSSKKLILKSGSILSALAKNIKATSNLLTGKTIAQSLDLTEISSNKTVYRSSAKNYILYKLLPNLKIAGIDKATNLYILTRNVGILQALSTPGIYDTLEEISTCLVRAYDQDSDKINFLQKITFLREAGFDFENMFTKDNIFDLFPRKILKLVTNDKSYETAKTETSEFIIENTKTFLSFVTPKDFQKIIQHNFNFLCQDPQVIVEKLKEIVENNPKDIKGAVENYINEVIKEKTVARQTTGKSGKKTESSHIKKGEKDHIEITEGINEDFLLELGENLSEEDYAEITSIIDKIDGNDMTDDQEEEEIVQEESDEKPFSNLVDQRSLGAYIDSILRLDNLDKNTDYQRGFKKIERVLLDIDVTKLPEDFWADKRYDELLAFADYIKDMESLLVSTMQESKEKEKDYQEAKKARKKSLNPFMKAQSLAADWKAFSEKYPQIKLDVKPPKEALEEAIKKDPAYQEIMDQTKEIKGERVEYEKYATVQTGLQRVGNTVKKLIGDINDEAGKRMNESSLREIEQNEQEILALEEEIDALVEEKHLSEDNKKAKEKELRAKFHRIGDKKVERHSYYVKLTKIISEIDTHISVLDSEIEKKEEEKESLQGKNDELKKTLIPTTQKSKKKDGSQK